MAETIPFRPKQGGSGQTSPSDRSPGAEESAIELFNQLRKQAEQGRPNHQSAVSEANSEARKIKKPPFLIYFILYYLALQADVLSFLEKFIEATGWGAILIFALNVILSAFFFAASFWLGRKVKSVKFSGDKISQISEQAIRRIEQYEQWAASLFRSIGRSSLGRRFLSTGTGRRLVGVGAKLARASKSPVFRNVAAVAAEIVPILDLVPWYMLNVYLTHRDHRREYTAAQASIMEAKESLMFEQQQLSSFNESLRELGNELQKAA